MDGHSHITSERIMELMRNIVHTPGDLPELVDTTKLVRVGSALRELVLQLDRS